MNLTKLSNLTIVLGSGNEYSDEDESSLETITSGYKEFASVSAARTTITPFLRNMNESVSEQPLSPQVAAFVGIDWADQKHDVVLRSVYDPAKAEHQIIKSEIIALADWIAQMHERFGQKVKCLSALSKVVERTFTSCWLMSSSTLSDQSQAVGVSSENLLQLRRQR